MSDMTNVTNRSTPSTNSEIRPMATWCSSSKVAALLAPIRCGVYEALHEAGIEPDWIIGTSIGAINASIIAGNEIENRLDRSCKEFWRCMERNAFWSAFPAWTGSRMPVVVDDDHQRHPRLF